MHRLAIDVKGVTKSFGKTEVLHEVTLAVEQGEIMGLVGPSGCGKTTLIDLVCGLTIPNQGTVLLQGEAPPFPIVRPALGFMPQDTALYEDITAHENIAFFGSLYGLNKKELSRREAEVLQQTHLDADGNKMVRDYSGGMKRRLSLAVALLNEPEILLMDEPTVGLDPVHRKALWSGFHDWANKGSALLVTTHIMEEANRCDRVAMMHEGRIICCDRPAAIIERSGCPTLEEAFIALTSSKDCEVYHA